MSVYLGKPAEKINQAMKTLIPETSACSHADFPMLGDRWLKCNETTPKGEPCFIKTENKLPAEGFKTAYIWGPGPYSFGYYHLLTKSAHVLIYNRILMNKVHTGADEGLCDCCLGSSDPLSKLPTIKGDDRDDLRLLFHARSISKTPNDGQAKENQLAESTATANAHYMYDQGILIAGGAEVMNRM
mmetsp:Transcript_127522/g.190057  ORF Transcript_127522/g.190057 Transcript_127522/m.190057 type:complete len:186 (+) Transcript_127522:138-695(+)|eukprot:CAMPEP_0117030552 /NCGR_PEP_ID=MMETSP0472-20121206/22045_1 /TAXON_ID=693140 ORGANISM="Tiarina fusus, Strain LIS" /NCGR_SAMPLE_ID=MMETSP0472 /ASSEMBLY_ACC=CAM_ASM_000603 /LENGTH=185 /DNA_ID=CAMNT_0004738661 /DNA_START=138 /DNA_END=695 /DNA_ORIENTATION=-